MNNFAFDFSGFKLFSQICQNCNHFHYIKKKGRRKTLDSSGNNEILLLADQFRDILSLQEEGQTMHLWKKNHIWSNFSFPISKCAMSYSSHVSWMTHHRNIEISWSTVILQGIPQEMSVVGPLLAMGSESECSMPVASNAIAKALYFL